MMSKLSGTCGPLFEKEEAGGGREGNGWVEDAREDRSQHDLREVNSGHNGLV